MRVSIDCIVVDVGSAVGLQPVQVVPVVDHHPTGVVQPSPGGIAHPVDSPETGTVTKVEICHGVQCKISPFLLEEISGSCRFM